MKERPILFNGPMVRALLAGTKTQTRRVIKGSPKQAFLTPETLGQVPRVEIHGEWTQLYHPQAGKVYMGVQHPDDSPLTCVRTPYEAGMRLWVREAWAVAASPLVDHTFYRADGEPQHGFQGPLSYWERQKKWRPSIHMPRWASRITLEITGVRVERLNEISEADAEAEGVDTVISAHQTKFCRHRPAEYSSGGICVEPADCDCGNASCLEHYAALWESINGPGSWDLNPWVWVVEFKLIKP